MLYIVRGLPGSGKSTFAKNYILSSFSYGGCWHVEADMFWMRPNGVYDFNPKLLKDAHEWCLNKTKQFLKGADVVVSNTFTTKREIQPYIDMSLDMGVPYIIIRCDGNYGSIHNVPEETLKKMKERFVDIDGEIYVEDYKRILEEESKTCFD